MSDLYAYDIETGPTLDEYLLPIIPRFKAPANWKDQNKISDNIAEQQRKWVGKAALTPETGMVYGIGVMSSKEKAVFSRGDKEKTLADEKDDIRRFFQFIETHHANATFIGWNTNDFDIPFLVGRAIFHGIPVPPSFYTGGSYGSAGKQFRDLCVECAFGSYERKRKKPSLQSVAVGLGVGDKSDIGKFYAEVWRENREEAITYLENDLKLTLAIGNKMRAVGIL